MKIVVIGGIGGMGRVTVRDLSENPEVKEILIADYQEEKAKESAASFKDPRIKGAFVDAYNIDETANLIKGYDAVCNTAQFDVNIHVMKACLQAGVHNYNDLAGLFYMTQKQTGLFGDFKKAGATAVLSCGVCAGITNVMARYAYDRLDEVNEVHFESAGVDLTDTKGIDVFRPSFALTTIMRESVQEPVEFINGDYKTQPLFSGEEVVNFPKPLGPIRCARCIHAELATVPVSFKDKGVKEVTFRINLGADTEEVSRCLYRVGMASERPIKVHGVEVVPLEVLCAVVNRELEEKLEGVDVKLDIVKCHRARVIGKKDGKKIEYIIYTITRPHSRWGVYAATGVTPSIVAQMQVKGMIREPGVWGPEQVVNPEYFFKELAKREIYIKSEIKENITEE